MAAYTVRVCLCVLQTIVSLEQRYSLHILLKLSEILVLEPEVEVTDYIYSY